jgi:hypothetical protein
VHCCPSRLISFDALESGLFVRAAGVLQQRSCKRAVLGLVLPVAAWWLCASCFCGYTGTP